jgi:hypothetical protein
MIAIVKGNFAFIPDLSFSPQGEGKISKELLKIAFDKSGRYYHVS